MGKAGFSVAVGAAALMFVVVLMDQTPFTEPAAIIKNFTGHGTWQ